MLKEGMYVRVPYDDEFPSKPRTFLTGIITEIDTVSETTNIMILDPFHYREYYDVIPNELESVSLLVLTHCHINRGTEVLCKKRNAIVLDWKKLEDEYYEYYLLDKETRKYFKCLESEIKAPFTSGDSNPVQQLRTYEFQNPCWYMGRQIVTKTMSILNNSIYGLKQLAGSRIFLKTFQLETVIRCLQNEPCRYMIADEVGLGKTVEACSILKIYLSQNNKSKILIIVPYVLLAQWRTELVFKFRLYEGNNENDNAISLVAADSLTDKMANQHYDFVIVDEIHNYINNGQLYHRLHELSKNASNVLLLSATPIQQRKEEYLKLLQLVLPAKYDDVTLEQFEVLVSKQARVSEIISLVIDDLDTLQTEIIPEMTGITENLHESEEVNEVLEEIVDDLNEIADIVKDSKLSEMIETIDINAEDFGIYNIEVIIAYVCDNYQLERNIIRGRRAVLNDEFSKRELDEIDYEYNDDDNYYEGEAYHELTKWIISIKEKIDTELVETIIRPLMCAFFSSPWAYKKVIHQCSNSSLTLPNSIFDSSVKWCEDEDFAIDNLADILDDPETHPSRLIKITNYIDLKLMDRKVVLFTNYEETFAKYYEVLRKAYGDSVTAFGKQLSPIENEVNMYRFQTDPKCTILICDQTGGEGRNLQVADYIIHIDLPWDINILEQRIGRLDRLGRDIEIPVTSVIVHSKETYEDQLFRFWNDGLNVFRESLSGLEIIMSDINQKISDSICNDFEYGLSSLIPEMIDETKKVRESVKREQIIDSSARRYKPLYRQMEKILLNYQMNESDIFAATMMSWASLSGFGRVRRANNRKMVTFSADEFSARAAQNSFLIPPDWKMYFSQKQNELEINVQRGYEERKEKNTSHSNRSITGTFDRQLAIQNDYIHFYSPGDEIFDCVVNNALNSYRGRACAFAAISTLDWMGFVYTFSISLDEKKLIDEGISLYSISAFRNYLASSQKTIFMPFVKYSSVPKKEIQKEFERIIENGYFHSNDSIEHLGRRGKKGGGFLGLSAQRVSNLDWFRSKFDSENWLKNVNDSVRAARAKASKEFYLESDLVGAKENIDQILAAKEAAMKYYGNLDNDLASERKMYDVIYSSIEHPVIRLESAAFMWLKRYE